MSEKLCRFGILGTAGIARKNWKAMRLSGNACVAAVASRSVESASRFIDECSAQVPQLERPVAFGSYDELLASDLVDAVYIPLPTALRHPWVLRAAEAGKHVIAEKPAALNATQVAEMVATCEKHGVQYMDGVMFMHSQRLPLIRQAIHEQERLGKLKRLTAQFSFAGDADFLADNIRVNSDLEPHGCLGDLGWYCIRMFYSILGGQMPVELRARTLTELKGTSSPAAVPGEFSAELIYPDGLSASFYCSFLTQHQQLFHASGSEGYLRVDDFVLPFHGAEVDAVVGNDHFMVDNCVFHMERHQQRLAVREYDAGEGTAQEVRMIRNFSQQVLSGVLNKEWPKWTLDTQTILDACFESANQGGVTVGLS